MQYSKKITGRTLKEMNMSDLINTLKELQSMVTKMYAQTHGYHWNIENEDFPQYHKFFLKIYEDVYESIDTYAENVRKLGDKALKSQDRR